MSITGGDTGDNIIPGVKMNDDGELYGQNNMLQKRDALICLKDYTPKLKWKDFEKIIDVGSGDGNVTDNIKNYIPRNFKELIGCDINERMVQFANNKYSDSRTKFKVLDIEGDLPQELKGYFDHVFSFYALHWAKNQKKVFTNIYDLLSKGGECLLTMVGYLQLYSCMLTVTRSEKWNSLLPMCQGFASPYHDFQEPEKYINNMLLEIGFNNVDVRIKQVYYIYKDVNALTDMIRAVDPFRLSEESINDFIEDCVTVFRDMRVVSNPKDIPSNSKTVKLHYNMIVIHATKP